MLFSRRVSEDPSSVVCASGFRFDWKATRVQSGNTAPESMLFSYSDHRRCRIAVKKRIVRDVLSKSYHRFDGISERHVHSETRSFVLAVDCSKVERHLLGIVAAVRAVETHNGQLQIPTSRQLFIWIELEDEIFECFYELIHFGVRVKLQNRSQINVRVIRIFTW